MILSVPKVEDTILLSKDFLIFFFLGIFVRLLMLILRPTLNINILRLSSFQVTHCCVVWSVSECWMRTEWSLITCWVWKSRISWSVVCKLRCSNWDSPSPSITPGCWSGRGTSGNSNFFMNFSMNSLNFLKAT